MSNDLVKRLRDWSEYDEGKINDAREEAADRIEQLEAAINTFLDDWDDGGPMCLTLRAALEGKKDER